MTINEIDKPVKKKGDVWKKFDWIWSVVYALAFLLPTVLFMLTKRDGYVADSLPLVLALVIFGLLLHVVARRILYVGEPGDTRAAPLLWRLIYCTTVIAIWFSLTLFDNIFFFVLSAACPEIGRWLPLRAAFLYFFFVLVAYIALITGLDFGRLTETSGTALLAFVVGFGMVILFTFWLDKLINQSGARGQLLADLREAQDGLASAERRAGILQERQRLANDIHDTLAQGFSSIVMQLEAAEVALEQDPLRIVNHITQARRIARDNLSEARRVINDLRPEQLEELPLPDVLARLVRNWQSETSVIANLVITGHVEPLHPDVEVTLLRVTQESLSNVRKHANATNVQVTLSYMGKQIMLDVQDDGIGMDETKQIERRAGGVGLVAMRERVNELNGKLMIESAENDGTTIVVEIPL